MTKRAPPHRRIAIACTLFVSAMFGLAYASVPFYSWFCSVTGFGGKTLVATQAPEQETGRTITVRFDSNMSNELDWRFSPKQNEMKVKLGEVANMVYVAENLSVKPATGVATYNVSPSQAGAYFNKLACFCFTDQTLKPQEKREMTVSFFVDPELAKDKSVQALDTITLSYTFYSQKAPKLAAREAQR
ncbi:MAG: cytochrome c oxidase assembly protein [Pseudomonadota bacterium]